MKMLESLINWIFFPKATNTDVGGYEEEFRMMNLEFLMKDTLSVASPLTKLRKKKVWMFNVNWLRALGIMGAPLSYKPSCGL